MVYLKAQLPIPGFIRKWGPCFIILSLVGSAQAQVTDFSTDFESDTIGAEPAGFAALLDTGTEGQSLNVIADESPFVDGPGSGTTGGPGSQALQWLDNVSDSSNPDIFIIDAETGTTQDLVIRFDFRKLSGFNLRFMIYDDSTTVGQPFTGTRAVRLDLDNGGRILNNGSGEPLAFTGTSWHSIEITTNLANNTYDLVHEIEGGSVSTFTDLPFNSPVTNVARVWIGDLSGAANQAEFIFDNISVTVQGATTWADYDIGENGWVDTTPWLSWINVSAGDYIWSASLNKYIYLPESFVSEAGAWTYVSE
jgi:hypothetical protein